MFVLKLICLLIWLAAGGLLKIAAPLLRRAFKAFKSPQANFRQLGIEIDYSQNISFMTVPIMGSQTFIDEFIQQRLQDLTKTLDVLVELPNPHVAHYFLGRLPGSVRFNILCAQLLLT